MPDAIKLKSQSAMEFVVLASFMLLVILGFFAVTSSRVLEAKEEGNRKIARDIADFAYREIEIAKSVNDGYARAFAMPETMNGIGYIISIVDNRELVVNYLDYEYVLFLPSNVTGNITKGINIIKKEAGLVFINGTGLALTPLTANLLMRYNNINAVFFDDNGNVVLRGALQQNIANLPVTADDEFIFKDRNSNAVAAINLATGNMFIKGGLLQNQATLTPSALSSDFIIKNSNGEVIGYIDESGSFYLKGSLTQNGNP